VQLGKGRINQNKSYFQLALAAQSKLQVVLAKIAGDYMPSDQGLMPSIRQMEKLIVTQVGEQPNFR
jgi:hypothetical protein